MKKIAIFCSGFGSNLQAVITAVEKGKIKAKISVVVSDQIDSYALVRAKKAGIPILYVDPQAYKDRQSYERVVVNALREKKVDFVVLAGFMRILTPYFIRQFKDKIINIHPALLPSFKGIHGITDALEYGVKITGVTVHFIDDKPDNGPIIFQGVVTIRPEDNEETLAKRIHRLEHRLYPEAIRLLVKGKLILKGRKVEIKK
ncbi:MAG: phosphoribosylglycinamide formyltransferase [PVC group bacterium]|nr:phosphoribosylglycinamide formyltransferase [PVC group bacterium]